MRPNRGAAACPAQAAQPSGWPAMAPGPTAHGGAPAGAVLPGSERGKVLRRSTRGTRGVEGEGPRLEWLTGIWPAARGGGAKGSAASGARGEQLGVEDDAPRASVEASGARHRGVEGGGGRSWAAVDEVTPVADGNGGDGGAGH